VPQETSQDQPGVDEIVALLTPSTADGSAPDLRAHCKHAEGELDAKRAEAFADLLLEYLESVPDAFEELEAAVVLWLAHPKALARRGDALAAASRRLATVYERRGDVARAQALLEQLSARNPGDKSLDHELASLMQRTGNADRLVERYLKSAEEAIREGRRQDAVTWLREVLAVDRSRRDVARMIRDLQFEAADKRRAWRRRLRSAAMFLVLVGLVLGGVWRESWLQQRYDGIAPAEDNDLPALRERLDEIDQLIAANPLWWGAFRASGERAELRVAIAKHESRLLREQMAAEAEHRRRLDEAESNYVRAREAVNEGDLQAALERFTQALAVAPPEWSERARTEADVEAIRAWLQQAKQSKESPR
jgi:tetratricopeptide (TPR) repeat protein